MIQDQQLGAVAGPKSTFLDRLFPKAQAEQRPIDSARGLYNWSSGQAPPPEPVATTGQLQTPTAPAYGSGSAAQRSAGTGFNARSQTFADASGAMPHPNALAPVSLGPSPQAPAVPSAPLQAVSLGPTRPAPTPPTAPRSTDPNSVFLGPRSKNPALQAGAPSAAASTWSLAYPTSGATETTSTTMPDGSQVMPNVIDYDTQYAQQLSDLIPQFQQIGSSEESDGDQGPAISSEAAQIPESAIERASSGDYQRVVGKIAEGFQSKRGSGGSILDKYRAHLLAGAYMVAYSDPELAQSMRDIAGGLAPRGIKNLREYVDSKITDDPTSKQFKDEFDEAAAEAQKAPNSGAAQPAMRKLLDHLVKFAQEKASSVRREIELDSTKEE